jgi:subtilisin family serine protease
MAAIAAGVAASTIAVAGSAAFASTVRHDEWWLAPLGIRRAWTASKGAGQIVAVLSDGVLASHVDLIGSVTTGPDYTGTSQSGGQYFGAMGTPIASIIAGHGHASSDATGMMGIAPLARILSVRVTLPPNDPELAQSAIASRLPDAIGRGIMYAVQHGATVIDLPLDPGQPGVGGVGGAAAAQGGSSSEERAVAYALAHNVVLVAPAGDDGAGTDAKNFPAAYPGVIAVGAFGAGFVKTQWTSRQSYVTVTAAGANIVAAANNGGYQVINTTGAASAVVSGIVALIRSSFPELTPAQVRTAIINGTEFRHTNGLATGSGYGAINAELALSAAAAEVPAADRAGAGSQALATQPAPTPATPQTSITRQIVQAAAISGAVLVILLALIWLYAGTTRRRATRQRRAAASGWSGRQQPSRYPPPASADGERMAEYFAAPAARSAQAPVVSAADRDLAPTRPAGSPAVAGTLGTFAASPGGTPPSPWADSEPTARSPLGPASRAINRRPVVSGSPPWEPAVQPHTVLPWTATPQLDAPLVDARPTTAAPREAGSLSRAADALSAPAPAPATPEIAPMRLAATSGDSRSWLEPANSAPPSSAQPDWDDALTSDIYTTPESTAASPGPAGSPDEVSPGRLSWSPDRQGRHSARRASGPMQIPGSALPVRQPGQTIRQPMSPTGSLWERAVEPADHSLEPASSPDADGRPMFAWQPEGTTENTDEQSAERAPWRPDWRVPEWTDGSGPGGT